MRALAVLLVAGYHVFGSRVSGGVDVFLLLTGFLLTASTARRLERTGRVGARAFWTGLLQRLLPTTALVLVAAVGAGLLLLPASRWEATVPHWFAGALFYENWQLALDAVDYAAARDEASPVQHLWSMSIQGQFYLVLPALAAIVLGAHRLTGARVRVLMGAVLGLLFAASLTYAVLTTATRQPFAYFDTGARLWEFALGGLLALVLPHLRLPLALRVLAGWAGAAGLVCVGALVDVTSLFPGWLALWPLGAAALVLVAGATGSRLAVDRLLTSRPARHLGAVSFALYLWHWPVLVYFLVLTGQPVADPWGGLAVLGTSLVLAEISHALVERPVLVRRVPGAPATTVARPRGHSARVVVLWLVPALGAATVFAHVTEQESRVAAVPVDGERHPGAAVLTGGAARAPDGVDPVPSPVVIAGDWVQYRGCESRSTVEVRYCDEPSEHLRSVLVVGDSHSQQLGALVTAHAQEQGFGVRKAIRGACPLTTYPEHLERRPHRLSACEEFVRAVLDDIAQDPPDLVVTVGSRSVSDLAAERVPDGYVDAWRELAGMGVPVLALRDNPRWTANPVECVLRAGADGCGRPREDAYPARDPLAEAVRQVPGVSALDTSDLLCTQDECPAVVGNVHVYMDDNHVSDTYVRTMAQAAEPELRRLVDWWR